MEVAVELGKAAALVASAEQAMWAGECDRAIADYVAAVGLQTAAGANREAAMTCAQLSVLTAPGCSTRSPPGPGTTGPCG